MEGFLGSHGASISVVIFSSLGDENLKRVIEILFHVIIICNPVPNIFKYRRRTIVCVLISTVGNAIPPSARVAGFFKKRKNA
jgi:hypothetical protein